MVNCKKYILLQLLLLTSIVSFSQNQLIINANVDMGISRLVKDNFENSNAVYAYNTVNFYYGYFVSLGIEIENHSRLFTGLSIQNYSWGTEFVTKYQGSVELLDQRYISIPIYYQIYTGRKNKPHFYVNAGVYFQFLNKLHWREGYYDKNAFVETGETDNSKIFRQTTINPFLQTGLLIPINKGKIELTLGPKVQYQASNNFNDDTDTGHLIAYTFHLGINVLLDKTSTKAKHKI